VTTSRSHATIGILRKLRRVAITVVAFALSLVGLCFAWSLAAISFDAQNLFPGPLASLARFGELMANGELLIASLYSLMRIFVGFAIGCALGVIAGSLMGMSRIVRAALAPYIHFIRFIPPVAWFAPVLLWVGAGEAGKIILIIDTTVFIVAINTMLGVHAINVDKIRMALAMGATRAQLFLRIILPGAAAYIFTGMRLAMGNSFATIVAAELLASTSGLGFMITNAQNLLEVPTMFAAILMLGILGYISDVVLESLVRRFGGRYLLESKGG